MNVVIPVDENSPDSGSVDRAVEVIRSGGIIVYPTETLYGIGADALNPNAIERVHKAKHRLDKKPILVIVNSREMLRTLVDNVAPVADVLMQRFWPGPLTLVFKSSDQVPAELTQGTGTIGVRIPSSRLCQMLVASAGVPLTSTSANISGEPPARSIEEIKQSLVDIDMYLDAGKIPERLPSTVVDVSGDVPKVLRPGAIATERIQQVFTEHHF